ncbi:hypothetical protein T484DRAFT_1748318 [Baffinella frigidus]|nr:hypothetical protein T484DRAFT_1748318 [Cryptophyta sp. CCMP2293]
MPIQSESAGAEKESAALAYRAVMRLASRGDDSSFGTLLRRFRTAKDSANSTAANFPMTSSAPATSSGVRSPEVSSAASTVQEHDLLRLATRAFSLPNHSPPQSQPRPEVARAPAPAPVPKSSNNASPTREFQSSNDYPVLSRESSTSASPTRARSIMRRRSSTPEAETRVVTFAPMVQVRAITPRPLSSGDLKG